MSASGSVFNPFARVWQPYPEYFKSPWDYYCTFIKLLKSKNVSFATMSEALAMDKDSVTEQAIVLLDHHIDFYPIETEVMAKWEKQEGIVSSIYLFNLFDYGDSRQLKDPWTVEDLNIKFYQSLERSGFEIGYHQNAVGLVRVKRDGRLYQKEISTVDLEIAKNNFSRDVDGLRQHFNIRTYIPHGAGEANNQLFGLPEGYDDLTWVYNNTRKNGTAKPPIKWRNFSDSVGVDTQKISGFGARFNVNRDNLHIKAYLMDPGFHHILLHSGRFAVGMPLEEYSGEINLNKKHVDNEFNLPDKITAPLNSSDLLTDEIIKHERKQLDPHIISLEKVLLSHAGKYYALTDNEYFAVANLRLSDKAIVNFLHHRKHTDADDSACVFRGVGKPREFLLPSDSLVQEIGLFNACGKLLNQVFCPYPLKFLVRSKFPFSIIYLEKLIITKPDDIKHIISMIDIYHNIDMFHIQVDIKFIESLGKLKLNMLLKRLKNKLEKYADTLNFSHTGSNLVISSSKMN